MKNLFLLNFILFLTSSIFGQNLNEENLKKTIDSLEKVITDNNGRIEILKKTNLETEKILMKCKTDMNSILLEKQIGTIFICTTGTLLYEKPDGFKSICPVITGNKVKVIEVLENYYKVYFNDHTGFVNKAGFQSESKIIEEKIKNEKIESEKIERNKRSEEESILEMEERRSRLIKQFGKAIGERIFYNEIWIGMTAEMVRESKGRPKDINKTVGSWGVHEQWIYNEKTYLYLENGKLVSWQY
jgi:hypothetical protein